MISYWWKRAALTRASKTGAGTESAPNGPSKVPATRVGSVLLPLPDWQALKNTLQLQRVRMAASIHNDCFFIVLFLSSSHTGTAHKRLH